MIGRKRCSAAGAELHRHQTTSRQPSFSARDGGQVNLCSFAKYGVKIRLLHGYRYIYQTGKEGFVMFQREKSETRQSQKVIPQGSSLLPTLFNYAANALLQLQLPISICFRVMQMSVCCRTFINMLTYLKKECKHLLTSSVGQWST